MMPKVYRKAKPRRLASTVTEDARPQSLSAKVNPSTVYAKLLSQSLQKEDGIAISTPNTKPLLTPISRGVNRKGNDPQLLAGILRPTVNMMQELGMLTLVKLKSGKLAIVLTPGMFNDDLTLKMPVNSVDAVCDGSQPGA